jgi:hypothetical protein
MPNASSSNIEDLQEVLESASLVVLQECLECSEADTRSYSCVIDVTRLFINEHSL